MVWNKLTHDNLENTFKFLNNYPINKCHLLPEKMYATSRYSLGLFLPNNLHKLKTDLVRLQKTTDIQIVYPDFLKFPLDCNQPLDSLFLLCDYEVMACCSSVFKGNAHRFSLGFLEKGGKNWFKLYNSKPIRQFRMARFHTKKYNSPCDNCAFRYLSDPYLKRGMHEK